MTEDPMFGDEDEDDFDDGSCPDCGAGSDEECTHDCPSLDEELDDEA